MRDLKAVAASKAHNRLQSIVTVCSTETLADRFEHILRRLKDVKMLHSVDEKVELVIVLADRERYSPDEVQKLYDMSIPCR